MIKVRVRVRVEVKVRVRVKPNPFVVISAWYQNERLWVMRFVYYNI
jgi:hypothetical protein